MDSTQSLSKFQLAFLVKMDKLFLKFIRKCKGSSIAKSILRKKKKVGECILYNFKAKDKATVINTVWYFHKDANIDKWYRIESTEINLDIYGQLIF